MAIADEWDLAIDGWLRLPLASGATDCSSCVLPENQTLTATGRLQLQNLHTTDGDHASAEFFGDVAAARFDEQSIDPSILTGTTVVAGTAAVAAVGLGLVAKFVVGLFTRAIRDPLSHPRRAAIYAYVQENPGASFREITRETGVASGTCRHHLTRLVRADLVVERPHGASVRFFENHGKYVSRYDHVVLLREAPLKALYDWVAANPETPQKLILEAMEAQGWSRSTTQHRLQRLLEGGAVAIRQQGRLKFYSAAAPKVAPALGPALLAQRVAA